MYVDIPGPNYHITYYK